MKEITLTIDDETYRKANARAAQEGRSVSSMANDFLTKQAGEQHDRNPAASPHSMSFTSLLTQDEIHADNGDQNLTQD